MNKKQKKALYENIMKQVAITVKNAINETVQIPAKTDIYPYKKFNINDIKVQYHNTYTYAECTILIDIRKAAPAKEWINEGYTGNFIEECTLEYNLQGERSYGEFSLTNKDLYDYDLYDVLEEYIMDNPLTKFYNFLIKSGF